jgi:hypothetical protein
MPKPLPDFIQVQQDFANHIKDPNKVSCPSDIDDRHMAIYRDLFFKNIMGFLSGAFPVLAEIIGDERWQAIGREYFSGHNNKTPYFLEISREFLVFLEHEYVPNKDDPDYMLELAHYEWLELYVDVEPSDGVANYVAGDLITSVPILSAVVEGYLYQYPVHQISLENASPDKKITALIVYRGSDDNVGFAETNPFTLQLLTLLKEGGRSGAEVLELLLDKNGLADQQAAYDGGVQTLNYWQKLGIIRGYAASG